MRWRSKEFSRWRWRFALLPTCRWNRDVCEWVWLEWYQISDRALYTAVRFKDDPPDMVYGVGAKS